MKYLLSFSFLLLCACPNAQETGDSAKFDYRKIMSSCLDADVSSALPLFETGGKKISEHDFSIKTKFEDRFKYETDKSDYLEKRKSSIDSLLLIFHDYWRKSLLNTSNNYDAELESALMLFLNTTSKGAIEGKLKKYIHNHGMYTAGFGKTGKLYDLLVWRIQKDTTYSFSIGAEKLDPVVVFMDDFVTLGWEEYATLDRLYPGGWTNNKLYCVKKAYDLNSEDFLVSYLAHEGRHLADNTAFPKLSSPDLEYRAKLVELSLASKTLYTIIDFFINNSNYDSKNGHSVADYCAIRDLSKALFNEDFERDINKWKAIDIKTINAAAAKTLEENTKALQKQGKKVKKYIRQ